MKIDIEHFAELCREDVVMHMHDGDSIGTYNEKRLHRIFKRYITEDASKYEVKIGKYVADIVLENEIIEIQTAAFRALSGKIRYYFENTNMRVKVIYPLVEQKLIIRTDKQSGEVKSTRRSPKRQRDIDVMAHMFYLADVVKNKSLELCIAHVAVEEYRFSEAMRYRKKGRYDNDIRPVALLDIVSFNCVDNYKALLPEELPDSFCADEFSRLTGLKGRKLYSVLNFYAQIGVFDIKTEGRKNIYSMIKGIHGDAGTRSLFEKSSAKTL